MKDEIVIIIASILTTILIPKEHKEKIEQFTDKHSGLFLILMSGLFIYIFINYILK